MKTVFLRPRDRRTVREYSDPAEIPPGQIGSVSGTVYVRLIDGTLLIVTTSEPE